MKVSFILSSYRCLPVISPVIAVEKLYCLQRLALIGPCELKLPEKELLFIPRH